MALAGLPIVVAAVVAIHNGWVPLTDNAELVMRARDVFTSHTPLLGNPSTLPVTAAGDHSYHLGPMEFWALAVPVWLGNMAAWSAVVGVALLNLVTVVAIAVVAYRRGGRALLAVAMVLCIVLEADFGREVLINPWNPHVALLPLLLFLFLVWSVSLGSFRALPAAVVVGSFVAQAHLAYVGPVGVLGLFGAVLWAERSWRGDRRRAAAWLGGSAVVALACWSTVIWEQLTHHPGNLTLVSDGLNAQSDKTAGFAMGARAVASGLGVLPFWLRGPLSAGPVLQVWISVNPFVAVSAVVVLGGLLAVGIVAWRRRDQVVARLIATTLVALAVFFYTTSSLPDTVPAGYRIRYLWPLGAFAWMALGWGAARLRRVRIAEPRATSAAWATVAVAALLAVVGSTTHNHLPEVGDPINMAATRSLTRQVIPHLKRNQPYLIQTSGTQAFWEMDTGMIWSLDQRGFQARGAPGDAFMVGKWRVVEAPDQVPTLLVANGSAGARAPDAGWRRVAFYDGASPALTRAYRAAATRLAAQLGQDGILLPADLDAAIGNGSLAAYAQSHQAVLSPAGRAALRQLLVAQAPWEERQYAVYLRPPATPSR